MLELDYFPAVAASILHQASPASLLVLRTLSRNWRRRADILLFEHVDVTIAPDRTVLVRPLGTSLAIEWLRLGHSAHRTFREGLEQPISPGIRPSDASPLRAYVQARMEGARTIDAHIGMAPRGFGSPHGRDQLVAALASLRGTVRFFAPENASVIVRNPNGILRSRVRARPGPRDTSQLQFGWDAQTFAHRIDSASIFADYDERTHRVLQLLMDAGSMATAHLLRGPEADASRPVIAFHPPAGEPTEPHPNPGHPAAASASAAPIGDTLRPSRLTIVGGTLCAADAFGLDAALGLPDLCAALDAAAAAALPPAAEGRAHIRFLTPQAYHDEVGHARFALETRRDAYAPCDCDFAVYAE